MSTTEQIQYRLATLADAGRIAEVHLTSRQAAGLISATDPVEQDMAWRQQLWTDRLQDTALRTLLVEADGHLQGFVCYGPARDADLNPRTWGEILAVYLHPQNWRQGLGRDLCRRASAELVQQGLPHTMLWVMESNHRARRFYESEGFQPDTNVHRTEQRGTQRVTLLRYAREGEL